MTPRMSVRRPSNRFELQHTPVAQPSSLVMLDQLLLFLTFALLLTFAWVFGWDCTHDLIAEFPEQ